VVRHSIFRDNKDINEATNQLLEDEGWFPYIRIIGHRYQNLVRAVKAGQDVDRAGTSLVDSFSNGELEKMVSMWLTNRIFEPHKSFIELSIKRYKEGDYMSAISNISQRVEGILQYLLTGMGIKITQGNMVKTLEDISEKKYNDLQVFNVKEFCVFFKKYYFKNFDINTGDVKLSRHSAGHGIVLEKGYTKTKAFILYMVIDQLYFFLN
jgi:hypothetical protein